ncbi:MAG: class B sortase [Hespellia sp.]|nr:class B sortase [Hespellia sp.]
MSEKKKHHRGRRKKKKGNLIINIVLLLAIVVFFVSGVMLVRSLLPYIQAKDEYDKIKDLAIETKNDEEPEGTEEDAPGFSVDFASLLEINPDTVGWIRFDEPSIISYPIVQGSDNSEYLHRTFQANDNHLGAIFMAAESKADFTNRNTLIYGHNVKIGGEMFSQLKSYQDEDFYRQYPYFYIYTPDGKAKTYQIFSAGVVKEDADNYITSYASDEDYVNYLNMAKNSSLYDTGVALNAQSMIVSLSTCTNVREDERFLVQGVLIKEE